MAAAALLLMASLPLQAGETATGKPCHACHGSKVTGAVPHPPAAEKDCKSCHKSEGGNHQLQKGLYGVKKQGASLCYECHDNLSKEKSVHAPVQEGDCTGCHAPHHSPYKKLLKVAATGLCFECHDKPAFFVDETGSATGFRDSTTNLHALHVKGAGLDCTACHNAHAASQPKLLSNATKGKNGAEIMLNFTQTDSGGSCKMTCHTPSAYKR